MKNTRLLTSIVMYLWLAITISYAKAACFDRAEEPYLFKVDSHLHFQPFNGPSLAHLKLIDYLEQSGITHANVYGIGQTNIHHWQCLQHRQCGQATTIMPTIKNDIINAQNISLYPQTEVQLTLSMTFPNLQKPASIMPTIELLAEQFPGYFQWMGEVNLVKQALYPFGHQAATLENIKNWQPFMAYLAEHNLPLALHSDLGNDEAPTQYLHLMQAVLKHYPNQPIIWMHMGLSYEQRDMDAKVHTQLLREMMQTHPNLWLDISWDILYDYYFRPEDSRPYYVSLLNEFSHRVLTGSDLVANFYTRLSTYQGLHQKNSFINQFLNDEAFRNIALGQSYFNLLNLTDAAPEICNKNP